MVGNSDANLDFQLALHLASTNWIIWRDVWMHDGPPAKSPIFNQDIFFAFLNEYSVLRGFNQQQRKEILKLSRLDANVNSLIEDEKGGGITFLSKRIQCKMGNYEQVSFASKLASFLAPKTFVASDRFSRKGVYRYMRQVVRRPETHESLRSYPYYLALFNEIWKSEDPHLQKLLTSKQGCAVANVKDVRFRRRMLDVLLMLDGGRWRNSAHSVFPLAH